MIDFSRVVVLGRQEEDRDHLTPQPRLQLASQGNRGGRLVGDE